MSGAENKTIRLKLLIAYDGRKFRGWQSQATRDGVQDFLEKALAQIVEIGRAHV